MKAYLLASIAIAIALPTFVTIRDRMTGNGGGLAIAAGESDLARGRDKRFVPFKAWLAMVGVLVTCFVVWPGGLLAGYLLTTNEPWTGVVALMFTWAAAWQIAGAVLAHHRIDGAIISLGITTLAEILLKMAIAFGWIH